jgi:SAM-dependent methyltransferase
MPRPVPPADRARLKDLLDGEQDHQATVDLLTEALAGAGLPAGATIREVGCGGGRRLALLRSHYAVEGVEPSEDLRALAQERLGPEAPLWASIPSDAPLADAVVSLSAAFGRLKDLDALEEAVRGLVSSVRPGGIVVIAPWLGDDDPAGQARMDCHSGAGVKIVRSAVVRRVRQTSRCDWLWMVAQDAAGVSTFEEREELLVADEEQIEGILLAAGLAVSRSGRQWIGCVVL